MFKKLKTRKALKQLLTSDGEKTSVNFSVVVNNDEIRYFDTYELALDYIEQYRVTNQIFSLAVFRIEFYSLVSNLKN